MPGFFESDQKLGGESNFVTQDGLYDVIIDNAYSDDKTYTGGTFYKKTIEMTVISPNGKGKCIKGDILKPKEEWATAQDREWGGWNALTISKYAIGAGLENETIENVKQLCDALKGKEVTVEVKMQEGKNGYSYAKVVDVFKIGLKEVDGASGFMSIPEGIEDELPFV